MVFLIPGEHSAKVPDLKVWEIKSPAIFLKFLTNIPSLKIRLENYLKIMKL